jgi:hypothetical protein
VHTTAVDPVSIASHNPPDLTAILEKGIRMPQSRMERGFSVNSEDRVTPGQRPSKIQPVAKLVHQIHVFMQHREDQRALLFPDEVEHVVMLNS